MGVQGGVVLRYLPPQRVPVRPRQRHHLHSRSCRTRRRTRSASTAAADSAADTATAAATSTAAPVAAAAAGGRGGRGSAAKRCQLQQNGWRRYGRQRRVWKRQRGARWRREMRFLTVGALPTGRADSRGGGRAERAGTLFADAGPHGSPKLGSVLPGLFHGEKERLSRNCRTESRSWFNSEMPYDILPQNATTESGEVKVSETSHLTRPTEIQNSLALAQSTADRAVPCRKSKIFSAGKARFRRSRRTVAGQF